MRKERKNEYVIFRNGVLYNSFLWDSCIGYSCVMEKIRSMKDRFPNERWEAVKKQN